MGSVAAAAMDAHMVFVYGSLMADEVLHVLLNRVPQSSSAILNNHHRCSIKGRVYPAIIPVENKSVEGRVLYEVTQPELEILDKFEAVEYERRTVEVSLPVEKKVQVNAYVWGNKDDPVLYGEWDFEEWKKSHMGDFVKMTAEFMKEVLQPDSKTRIASKDRFTSPIINEPATSAAVAMNGASNDGHKVFVYGSLMADEVVSILLKRVPPSSPAILYGYHRFSIREKVYPAILPVVGDKQVQVHVQGRVLFGITDPELRVFDAFEDQYERLVLEVSLPEKKLEVNTYIWLKKDDPDLYGEWDVEEWRRLHMSEFLEMTVGFIKELQSATA
ncbi:unnamed protein product [Linum trigynum]|uniref:Putative gamma-glutamylcyclotransferase n=1 Tax=Linum trigynum TaxID=586398 RepID=A0AAV2EID7_9ROSI